MPTVSTGTGGVGTRHISRKWPTEYGLELGTTKRKNKKRSLEPVKDLVPQREQVGID